MNKRNTNEQKVYNLLLKCGIPKEQIEEPDKAKGCSDKNPDFTINEIRLAIEVKHFNDKKLLEEDGKLLGDFKNGKLVSYMAPIKNSHFERHLSDSTKKFKNYKGFSTIMIEDMTDFHFLKPDIEFLVAGMLTMHLSKKTGDILKYSNKDRNIRIDKNTEVGAICFIEKNRISIFHNLMAKKNRVLPYYFWAKKLENVGFEQYVFFAPPGQLTQIYKLEDVKL